jgi:hypothetical protein
MPLVPGRLPGSSGDEASPMNVTLTQPVEMALRSLGDEDRRKVLAWLDHLKNWQNDAFVRSHAQPLNSSKNVYVLKTSGDLRIFFKLDQDDIEVLDIAKKSTILTFGHVAEHGRP